MIEKLRSHLKDRQGFTLIELLVVIAIIAILVVIVIVAINPVQRLADAADRKAASNVRSTGTLLATCATQELSKGNTYEPCSPSPASTTATAILNGYGTAATGVTMYQGAAAGDNDICAAQVGAVSGASPHYYVYKYSTGTVTENAGAALPAAGTVCP